LNFKCRLKYRRSALLAIFGLFADDNGMMSSNDWIGLVGSLESYAIRDHLRASELFLSEDKEGILKIDCKQFFRLCGLLAAKVEFRDDRLGAKIRSAAAEKREGALLCTSF
jgi:hypothetical protein